LIINNNRKQFILERMKVFEKLYDNHSFIFSLDWCNALLRFWGYAFPCFLSVLSILSIPNHVLVELSNWWKQWTNKFHAVNSSTNEINRIVKWSLIEHVIWGLDCKSMVSSSNRPKLARWCNWWHRVLGFWVSH
jgi:hypothetical protein